MKLIAILTMTAAAAFACEGTKFGGGAGKKATDQDVLPAGGLYNEPEAPLDISETEQNKPIKDSTNGPSAAEGERLGKTIELDCDQSSGVVVTVDGGGSAGGKDPGIGDEPDPNFDPSLKLIGQGIDKDGKPVGGTPPDGGKKPLPEKPGIEVPKDSKVIAKVKGQFCPTSKKKLTVLFVVDFSGSMGRHVPEQGEQEVPGNDPQVAGTCGRLKAAEAIIARINAERKPGDEIQVGMVPFAGGIVTKNIMEITDFDSFAARVSKDTFCQYVVQNDGFGFDPQNPGGISGDLGIFNRIDSSTNYRAAFQAAETLLTQAYGRKVVYFISDGQPTSGGVDPIAAGAEAGARLRANVDNLSMNGLLLGDTGAEAEEVLELVTGSADRVRRAENASELADRILEFPEASIDLDTAKAMLSVVPYHSEELGFHFFGPHPTLPGVWLYETQPFFLVGQAGVEVTNVVDVTAQGSDGSTHAARVEIKYTQ